MEIELTVDKEQVMSQVAATTAYTGAKMEDEGALKRIPTVDEDEAHLLRFWEESRSDISQELIELITYEGMAPETTTYKLRLEVSRAFEDSVLPSMNLSLFSFFVYNITAKWYVYTNKGEAGDYADKAVTMLDDIHRKALYKKKPVRPTYN